MADYIWDMTDEEIEEEYRQNLVKKAVQEAVQETETEKARDFACKMLEGGKLSYEDIANYSGLTLAEVEALSRLQPA